MNKRYFNWLILILPVIALSLSWNDRPNHHVAASGSFTEIVKLSASDAWENDHYGFSVSVDGDTLVVGAYAHDQGINPSSDIGAAYVYERNEGGPDQ